MRDDEGSEPIVRGQDREKAKKKPKKHNHIGPNVRAFRAGRAFCPYCDAEKALRLTEAERQSEREARELNRGSRRS